MKNNMSEMVAKVNTILGGQFGFAEDDKYRIGLTGGVVAKGATGTNYRGFKASTGETVDVAKLAVGAPKLFMKLPIMEPRVGDLLENEGKPAFVTEIREKGGVTVINVEDNLEQIIPPKTGILGFATYTKVFSPFSVLKLDNCGSIFQGGEKAMDKILPIAVTGGALLAASKMTGGAGHQGDVEGMKNSVVPVVAATGLGYILSNLEGSELNPDKLKKFLTDNPIIVAGIALVAYSVLGNNMSASGLLPKEAEGLAEKLKGSFGDSKKLMMFGGLALGAFFLAKQFGVSITSMDDIKGLVSQITSKFKEGKVGVVVDNADVEVEVEEADIEIIDVEESEVKEIAIEDMKVADLKKLAEEQGVEIPAGAKKAEIVALLK